MGEKGKEQKERGQGTVKEGRRKTDVERKGEGGAQGGRSGKLLSALVVTAGPQPWSSLYCGHQRKLSLPFESLISFLEV